MSEKLCIQWNDFQENQKSAFGNLRKDTDFANVTLACDDGQQFSAHKVILASSSPLLRKLLLIKIHPHPLIFLRGVKSDDLAAILDFIYLGKANIPHENIEPFLAIAEDLGLKGFWDPTEADETEVDTFPKSQIGKTSDLKSKKENISNSHHRNVEFSSKNVDREADSNVQKILIKREKIMPSAKNLPELEELDQKVKAMMVKGENKIAVNGQGKTRRALVCKVCGKEGQFVTIRDHIESNHLEGIRLPCNMCGKKINSRHSLQRHKRAVHKESIGDSEQLSKHTI